MAESDISPETLRSLLDYNSETGSLVWKERPLSWFADEAKGRAWNTRWAGKPALNTRHGDGYRVGAIFRTSILAHRAAWAICHGVYPLQIDHINGVRCDNRLCNLRNVTPSENSRNLQRQSNNKSGFTGVSWNAGTSKWQVRIKADGKYLHLGLFDCLGAAIAARRRANTRFGYHPNHGREARV